MCNVCSTGLNESGDVFQHFPHLTTQKINAIMGYMIGHNDIYLTAECQCILFYVCVCFGGGGGVIGISSLGRQNLVSQKCSGEPKTWRL